MHDIDELGANFADFLERLGMDEELRRPLIVVLVHLPLFVDVQQRQVVALWHLKVLSSRVTLLLAILRAEEYRGDGEHRDNGEDLA